jgi:hypothetical protein
VSTCSFSCSPRQPTGTWRWTSPGRMFEDAGGSGKPRIGQIALSYDPTSRSRSSGRWSSSAGSPAAGGSTPSSRCRRRSRWRPGRCARRTWLRRCRGAGRRGQPRAVHHLGGNPAAASPPSVLTRPHESIVSGPVFFPVIPGWPGNGARSATRRRKEEFMADNWRGWHAHPWSGGQGPCRCVPRREPIHR